MTISRSPLPSELLHKILTSVLADSIHAISVSPEVTQWDMSVVWILAQTCYTWKEIVKGILTLAFAVGGEFSEGRVEFKCVPIRTLKFSGANIIEHSKETPSSFTSSIRS
jgi:hypothetical protein